jgi:hypothetical protein
MTGRGTTAWYRLCLMGAAALALAGCFEASGSGQAPAPPSAGGPNAATVAGPVPAAIAREDGPMTQLRAREICWMEVENNKKAPRDLEQRSKVVDQCISAKMGGR